MEIPLDILLRGNNHATSHVISPVTREPGRWTDDDVMAVLAGMLRALEQAKNPEADENRKVALRGVRWVGNPFSGGGRCSSRSSEHSVQWWPDPSISQKVT